LVREEGSGSLALSNGRDMDGKGADVVKDGLMEVDAIVTHTHTATADSAIGQGKHNISPLHPPLFHSPKTKKKVVHTIALKINGKLQTSFFSRCKFGQFYVDPKCVQVSWCSCLAFLLSLSLLPLQSEETFMDVEGDISLRNTSEERIRRDANILLAKVWKDIFSFFSDPTFF
jgi:hypothetical protein